MIDLTVKGMCSIIRTSGNAGVKRLVLPGTCIIEFTGKADSPAIESSDVQPDEENTQQIEMFAQEAIEQEELKAKEAYMDLMDIEDPVGFDALVSSGELEPNAEDDK